MPSAAPQAVLFDMDGTLFDSELLWDLAINELAASYGAVVPVETRLAMVGTSMHDSMELLPVAAGDTVWTQRFEARRGTAAV